MSIIIKLVVIHTLFSYDNINNYYLSMRIDGLLDGLGGGYRIQIIMIAGAVVITAFLVRLARHLLRENKIPLYRIDSALLKFMEHLGDGYNFTHIAVWATDQIIVPTAFLDRIAAFQSSKGYPTIEHKALIARGTVKVNDIAFFIAQFNDYDFIPDKDNDIDTNNTVGLGEFKPFVALFTGDKKIAALSITTSPESNVWVSQLDCEVIDLKCGVNKFVYKNELLVSTEFKEEEWILMDKSMKLRELNACIYNTSCSGKKYDVNNNNSRHFVSELWNSLKTCNERTQRESTNVIQKDDLDTIQFISTHQDDTLSLRKKLYYALNQRELEMEEYLKNGKDIYDTYCTSTETRPIMLPKAPQHTYIDVYPDEGESGPSFKDDKKRQLDYETEVVVYRALEELLDEDINVLHSFEYTHRQYRLCDKSHVRKGCVACRKTPNNREGECDFLIIGKNYFVIIEVKNMTSFSEAKQQNPGLDEQQHKLGLQGSYKKSEKQRERMVKLIRSIENSTNISHFTAYPNFTKGSRAELTLESDQLSSVIFKEDTEDFASWWKGNVTDFHTEEALNSDFQAKHDKVRNMLLAIWCTDNKGHC
ncbi:uncharacterized protein LOC134818280 [Bolinopsis microptera]|uniref:uncharacterized protein LOC134818280 n=1 Tax=Bolinopsis microptera TaxID=2820187 RepID=UPI00307A279D